jgi:hypothetical protein
MYLPLAMAAPAGKQKPMMGSTKPDDMFVNEASLARTVELTGRTAARPTEHIGVRVEAVRSLPALGQYESAWNRLAADAPQRLPMLSGSWIITNLDHTLNPGQDWACLMALEEDELVGVFPVVSRPYRFLGRNRPRLRTPHQGEIMAVDFVSARGREHEVIPRLLQALDQQFPDWLDFELYRIPVSSPTLETLTRRARSHVAVREFLDRGSIIPINGSLEGFQQNLSHNFRRNLVKARNKLARLPNVRTVFLSGKEATEQELDRFIEVEGSGWKGQEGTAIRNKPHFYRDLAQRLSKLGWLEWHFLFSGDRTLAGHMAIRVNRRLVLLKIGYDEAFSHCAPGNMLLERTLQRAFASGDIDEIDCLTDMAWHDNWAMAKRPYYNLWIYPRRGVPLLKGALPRLVRERLRHLPGLRSLYRRVRSLVQG